jgi:hypothetical protein
VETGSSSSTSETGALRSASRPTAISHSFASPDLLALSYSYQRDFKCGLLGYGMSSYRWQKQSFNVDLDD